MPADATATGEMTIGRFSRESRLSLKALRLYAELGLLPPHRVDEGSGYRYYSHRQLAQARLIASLRQLEMPLERIARLLELGGPEQAEAVESYWREVEGGLGARRKLVAHLMARLRNEDEMTDEIAHVVKTRSVPEQKLITIEERTLADALPALIERNMGTLIRGAAERGVKQAGPMLIVYHGLVSMDADGPVEVCMPVEGDVEPFGNTRVRLEPAHVEAYARIPRKEVVFPEILRAYESVEAWMERGGRAARRARSTSPRGTSWARTTTPATSRSRLRPDSSRARCGAGGEAAPHRAPLS